MNEIISFPYPMVGRKMKKLQNKKKAINTYLYKLLGRQSMVLKTRTLNFILKKEEKVPNAGPILSQSFWLQIPKNEIKKWRYSL